jgi:hypothetical protein
MFRRYYFNFTPDASFDLIDSFYYFCRRIDCLMIILRVACSSRSVLRPSRHAFDSGQLPPPSRTPVQSYGKICIIDASLIQLLYFDECAAHIGPLQLRLPNGFSHASARRSIWPSFDNYCSLRLLILYEINYHLSLSMIS